MLTGRSDNILTESRTFLASGAANPFKALSIHIGAKKKFYIFFKKGLLNI
jgi:hypothetical protein